MSQSPPVAVCPGPDFLALLAVLGAEFGGFALPLGLHALIDRLAVLSRKVDPAMRTSTNLDEEGAVGDDEHNQQHYGERAAGKVRFHGLPPVEGCCCWVGRSRGRLVSGR